LRAANAASTNVKISCAIAIAIVITTAIAFVRKCIVVVRRVVSKVTKVIDVVDESGLTVMGGAEFESCASE
jgi:hypothetical protein